MAFGPAWQPVVVVPSSSVVGPRAARVSVAETPAGSARLLLSTSFFSAQAETSLRPILLDKNTPPSGKFTRDQRLLDKAAFQQVFGNGRASRDRNFTVLFCENGLEHARLGLAIAKRRVRRASQRNRLKRLVRESFRLAGNDLPAVDLVIMAGAGAESADNKTIFASLAAHWDRVRRAQSKESVDKH